MNLALLTALLASLVLPPSVTAQAKPDFSGTWVMDASRSQSSVQNEPVKSMTVVIRHSPNEVKIETTRDDRQQTVTYKPGSPDAISSSGRAGLLAAIWYWQGETLVTETLSDVNGMTVTTKAIHALQAGGAELTIESLVVVEHGYTLRGGKNYGSAKDVFKRMTP
jgi:hypothetical protein